MSDGGPPVLGEPVTGLFAGQSAAVALDDLQGIFDSLGTAAVLLDDQLGIRLCTSEFEQIFGLRSVEQGRSIDTLPSGHPLAALAADAAAVLAGHGPRSCTVPRAGNSLDVRLTPLRDAASGRLQCLLTFTPTRSAPQDSAGQKDVATLAQIAESEGRFRRLLKQAPFMVAIHVGPEYRCIYANDAFRDWCAPLDPVGTTLTERTLDGPHSDVKALFDACYYSGEPQVAALTPATVRDAEGRSVIGYHTGMAQPYLDSTGATIGVVAVSYDATEQKLWHERQDILISELRHRVKNLLAVVQAVASFSAETAADKDELLDKLQDRLEAIARANDCLSSSNMQGQRLRRILDLELDQLEQVQRDSVIVTGDDPFLPAEAASILSLALHELTNNAIKYGALATPGARIEMTCRFDQRGTFHLDWHETMPKAPAPAGRSGFGTLLLTEVIARQLEAEVSHDLTDQGLRYAIRFVLSDGR